MVQLGMTLRTEMHGILLSLTPGVAHCRSGSNRANKQQSVANGHQVSLVAKQKLIGAYRTDGNM